MGVDDLHFKAGEIFKKALTLGVGAFFLTEESLRSLISEVKLPKELIAAILESVGKTKSDLLKTMPKEVISQILDRIDFNGIFREMLTQNEIEFTIRVGFHPKKVSKNLSKGSSSKVAKSL